MVAFATVYTQNHFALDALASVVLTPILMGVVVPWLEREHGKDKQEDASVTEVVLARASFARETSHPAAAFFFW